MKALDRSLIQAIEVGNVEAARMLLSRGADAKLVIESVPLLHLAAVRGIPETVSCLIDSGADLRQRNGLGMTALMVAAIAARDDGQVECLSRLIQGGAELDECVAPGGWNAIDMAGQWRNRRTVAVLSAAGCKPTTAISGQWVRSLLKPDGSDRGLY